VAVHASVFTVLTRLTQRGDDAPDAARIGALLETYAHVFDELTPLAVVASVDTNSAPGQHTRRVT
jgi:hypothetical protein